MENLQSGVDTNLKNKVHALLRELISSHDPRLKEIESVIHSAWKEAQSEGPDDFKYAEGIICRRVFEYLETHHFDLYGSILRKD